MSKKAFLKLEAVKTGEFEIEVELLDDNELSIRIASGLGTIKVVDVERPKTLSELLYSDYGDEEDVPRLQIECDCETCEDENLYDELDETSYDKLIYNLEEQAYQTFKKNIRRWMDENI